MTLAGCRRRSCAPSCGSPLYRPRGNRSGRTQSVARQSASGSPSAAGTLDPLDREVGSAGQAPHDVEAFQHYESRVVHGTFRATERVPHLRAVPEALMSVPPLCDRLMPFALITSVRQVDLRQAVRRARSSPRGPRRGDRQSDQHGLVADLCREGELGRRQACGAGQPDCIERHCADGSPATTARTPVSHRGATPATAQTRKGWLSPRGGDHPGIRPLRPEVRSAAARAAVRCGAAGDPPPSR